jgi:hypothetical protein
MYSMNMNKYIKEQNITRLIQSYIKYRVEEIYKLMCDFGNNLYADENQLIWLANPFNASSFIICVMTNELFVIIGNVWKDRYNCDYLYAYEKKFKKYEQNIYIKILKDLTNLCVYDFTIKYKEILQNPISVNKNNIYAILQKYNIKLYNINLLTYPCNLEFYQNEIFNIYICANKQSKNIWKKQICTRESPVASTTRVLQNVILEKIKENIIITYGNNLIAKYANINIMNYT